MDSHKDKKDEQENEGYVAIAPNLILDVGDKEMKKIWPIICLLLLVLLGVAIPLAYQRGTEADAELDDAHMAKILGQQDLEVLQALRAGNVERATVLQEGHVWDCILPVHHYRNELAAYCLDPDEVETFLRTASQQFRNHPAVLGPIMPEEEALRRADAAAAKAQSDSDLSAEDAQHLFRIGYKADHQRHSETRNIVLMYLERERIPNKALDGTSQ